MDDGIGSWPTKHASRTPERVALIDGDTGAELTWADLEARTNARRRPAQQGCPQG